MNTAKESGTLRDIIEDGRELLRKIHRKRDDSDSIPLLAEPDTSAEEPKTVR